ncbi:hypothetical protein Cgig2_021977 [Carnegiea gigantea]|uniref:Uncharacterized protein n=1 Tax=Carnegiea gigantea TaxID=171969 RepID=A0A9Q1QNI3_9CARY|nr:hypothetical protein Cgig2_021977 [Carnegiea gigantea]
MEKIRNYGYPVVFSAAFTIGLVASAFCVVAEFKKSKEGDLKLDGKLCYLPASKAYGFGVSALICSSTAMIVGNLIVFLGLDSGERRSWCFPKKPSISTALLVLSWLSFIIAVILMGTGTSMSRRQRYGKGWLDGECYLVKDGIFSGAAMLILLSLGCTSASAVTLSRNKLQVSSSSDEKPTKIIH